MAHDLEKVPTEELLKLEETLKEQLVVGPPLPLDQRVDALEKQIQEILNQINVINGKLEVLASHSPSAIGIPAQPGPSQTIEGIKMSEKKPSEACSQAAEIPSKMKEAEWDTEYINNLADNAFAVISAGGEKDEQGKTVPRTLRHLPHHNAQGDLDLPHLRNALARLPQTDLSAEDRAEAKRHLCAHAKESEIVSDVCGEETPKTAESTDIVALRKQLIETEAKLADVQKSAIEKEAFWQEKYTKLCEAIKGTVPPSHIWKAWRPGSQMMVQQLLKVLRESSESRSQT